VIETEDGDIDASGGESDDDDDDDSGSTGTTTGGSTGTITPTIPDTSIIDGGDSDSDDGN